MRLRHLSANSNRSIGQNGTNSDVYTLSDIRSIRSSAADNMFRQGVPTVTVSSVSMATVSTTTITPTTTTTNSSTNSNDQAMTLNQPMSPVSGQSASTDSRANGAATNSNNISNNSSGGAVPAPNISDQQLQTTNDDEQLPAGWEIRYDPFGRRYYVDHNTRSVKLHLM